MQNIQARFEAALAAFVDKVKPDPNVRAVIVMGSLANDVVWEKSDIDLTVLMREVKQTTRSFCVEEDGIILNVNLTAEFDFKRYMERSVGAGGMLSFYAKARVAFTKDEQITKLLADFQHMGADDRALAFFQCATYLVGDMEKIEKWLTVKDNLLYTQSWILRTADMYANMRLTLDGKPMSREAVLKLMEYDPAPMQRLYVRPLSGPMTREELWDALRFIKQLLVDNVALLEQPVAAYMTDNEPRNVTTLCKHFGMDSHGIYHVFDFLEEMGITARVTENTRITPKSRDVVEEVAFIYLGGNR